MDPIISSRTGREYRWQELDPSKADYGATHGIRGPHGSTFILHPNGITAIGLWSGTRTSLESVRREIELIEKCGGMHGDNDRSISAKTWQSWLKS